jgi:hypothetical protein
MSFGLALDLSASRLPQSRLRSRRESLAAPSDDNRLRLAEMKLDQDAIRVRLSVFALIE